METSAIAQFAAKRAEAESSVRKLSEIGDPRQLGNKSGIAPEGHAVLLLPYKPDFESSPIFIPEEVSRQVDMYEMRGIVVWIGPDAFEHRAVVRFIRRLFGMDPRTPRCKVGDKVMVSKFCGAMLRGPWDDLQYRMVNAGDIFARITGERTREERDNG